MVMFSSQVTQQVYQSQMAMAAQLQQAQMLSMQMGTLPPMAMPMMPQMNVLQGAQAGYGGIYGEQVANRLVGAARTGAAIGGAGLAVGGLFTGMPLDAFSGAWSGARLGYGAAGLSGGIAGAAMGALPFWAAGQAASIYGGAFAGGVREQAATNSTLRQNFNFAGGQGAFGRGFSQAQMGQIGQMVTREMGRSPFSSSQELNALIQQGAEGGMFTAVRDVETFSARFRTMLDGLRKIQKELGGTLGEALQFTRGTQQLGIFSGGTRTAFAAEMRETMATTGMDQNQLFSLAATGSMLSRATGGLGRQGAVGALRTARQVGAAVQSGAINAEALSEATGGLQGAEAMQAFAARTLQLSDRFSRTAAGRFSLFALANAEGTGLDAAQVARFRSGEISTGEIRQDAHTRVNRMGRARALNMEGQLRGAMMEEGGLAGQIGILRKVLGDRALDGGDDLAQLVIQRRMGVSRQEAQLYTSLMRNQGSIAAREDVEGSMSKRQVARQQDLVLNRSVDAFMANLQHGLQDATGVTAAREAGRRFLTRISTVAERTMNEFLGIQAEAMSTGDRAALTRLSMGMATRADRARLASMSGGDAGSGRDSANPFARSVSSQLLRGLGMHDPVHSIGEVMRGRGIDVGGMTDMQRETAMTAAALARKGILTGADRGQFDKLREDEVGTRRMLLMSRLEDPENAYRGFRRAGISANAADAAAVAMGFGPIGLGPEQAAGMIESDTALSRIFGSVNRGARAGYRASTTRWIPGGGNLYLGAAGAVAGAAEGVYNEAYSPRQNALRYISSGGHLGELGRQAAYERSGVAELGGLTRKELEADAKRRGTTLSEAMLIGRASQSVDQGTIETVVSSESFQSGLRNLMGGMNEKERAAELDRMRQGLASLSPEEQRAGTIAISQLETNMRANKGKVGREFATLAGGRRKNSEARMEYAAIGGRMQNVAELLLQRLPNSSINEALSNLVGAYRTGSQSGGKEAVDQIGGAVDTFVAQLSELDPESAEYQKVVQTLGKEGDDVGRGLITASSQRRSAVREMTGQGRRGWRGAADAIFGAVSGNMMGELDFTLNGRMLSKRNQSQVLFGAFKRGGKEADSLEQQLISQLSGVEGARDYVGQIRNAISKDGVQSQEAKDLFDKLSKDENIQKIRSEGILRQQQQSDPLGVARNTLLEGILAGVNKMAGTEPNQSIPKGQP